MEVGFSAAGHGNSFHSPVEIGRIISGGIALAQEARIKLARILGDEVPYPDISTKAKAQTYIGLEMGKYRADKKIFLENIIPQWINEGAEREKEYGF